MEKIFEIMGENLLWKVVSQKVEDVTELSHILESNNCVDLKQRLLANVKNVKF